MSSEVPFQNLTPALQLVRAASEEAFTRVYASSRFILGQEVTEFEREFAATLGVPHAVGVANGLDAIFLSLKVLGVGPGDEVIVPAHTSIATWLAVSITGATPVPADVSIQTCCLTEDYARAALSPRTKAVVPVHLYGHPAPMPALMQLADEKKIFVVEDNAQAVGAAIMGKATGAWGHLGATSFYPTKNLGALGDGGGVTTQNEAWAARVRQLRNYGEVKKFENEVVGTNSRLDELQAALLRARLACLEALLAWRRQLAQQYLQELNDCGDLVLPCETEGTRHAWHLFVVRTASRDALRQALAAAGIETMIHYPRPPYLQNAYASVGYKPGAFPNSEMITATCISLPLWYGMAERQCSRVAEACRNFYRQGKKK
jgi:dTDP-4-amino-4,6-dideoxygalactose transaminase